MNKGGARKKRKGVLYDKSLKECSSLLLIKEKYTSEPLASKNRIKSSKTLNISLITQMGAASVHSGMLPLLRNLRTTCS